MKRLILSTLIMSGLLLAKGTYKPLKPLIFKDDLSIKVNYNKDKNTTFVKNKNYLLKSIKFQGNSHNKNILISNISPITNKMLEFNNILSSIHKIDKIVIRLDKPKRKNINRILQEARNHLGKRYLWGAVGPKRFDCSGFTSYVCKKSGIAIPRTSIKQGKTGVKIRRQELKKGDLVFFDTSKRRRGYINHVGIYIGDQKFIHASSAKKRVVISSLNKRFYKARFKWGRRVKR